MVGERQRSGGTGTGQRVDRRTALSLGGAAVLGGLVGSASISRARASTHDSSGVSAPEDYEAVLSEMDGDGTAETPYVVTDVRELQAMNGDRDAHYVLGDHVNAGPVASWNETTTFTSETIGRADDTTTQTAHAPIVEGSVTITIEPVNDGSPSELPPSAYEVDLETGRITFDGQPGDVNDVLRVDYEVREPVPLGFEPIGSDGDPFLGTFDGQGYTIRNLTINRPGRRNVGLFGQVATWSGEAEPRLGNVRLPDVEVSGRGQIGGLVGFTLGGTVHDAFVSGTITGRRDAYEGISSGGLCGVQRGGTIRGCAVSVTVDGADHVGGLLGRNAEGTVRQCRAEAEVTGLTKAGGFVSRADGAVRGCVADSEVTGDSSVGGFVGAVYDVGTVSECRSNGTVDGNLNVGGFVGTVSFDGTVRSCKAATQVNTEGLFVGDVSENGTVTTSYAVGADGSGSDADGFAGFMSDPRQEGDDVATLRDCYWDAARTGVGDAVAESDVDDGDTVVENVQGLDTGRMQGEAAPSTMTALDFEEIWRVPDEGTYPPLRTSVTTGPTPVPVLTVEPNPPEPGEAVTFDASESHPRDSIDEFAWQFPDGGSGRGPTASHTFASSGLYEVTLELTHEDGQRATATTTVPVGSATPRESPSTTTGSGSGTTPGATDGSTTESGATATDGPDTPGSGGDESTTGGGSPGFGLSAAVAGVAGVGYALRRLAGGRDGW